MRTCPRCQQTTASTWCCGLDLTARKRWRMTRDRVRLIHVLALARKGLTDEQYRLRLGAVGVDSSLKLSRDQFHALLRGLRALPDSPSWLSGARHARRRGRIARAG
jgi:hypothetical protein